MKKRGGPKNQVLFLFGFSPVFSTTLTYFKTFSWLLNKLFIDCVIGSKNMSPKVLQKRGILDRL